MPRSPFHFLRALAVAVLLCSAAVARADEPLVILIGVDGFRWDYVEKLKPPTLSRLAAEGVRAERMVPSFPSLTFPNFYTLVTGLRPERHGIIGNNMFDPEWQADFSLGSPAVGEGRWWEGEPLWVTAQRQGQRAACMFWPGSEVEIGGVRPWDWRTFDKNLTAEARVQTVLDWLALPATDRPRLITLYFHEADTAGHRFGPDSPQTIAAVQEVDAALAQLIEGVQRLGLEAVANLVVVSDHGMAAVSPDRVIALSDVVKTAGVQVDFAGAVAGLRPPPEAIEAVYAELAAKQEHFRVYRREEVPERLHFRAHRRIPPLVLIADEGWMLVKRPLLGAGARAIFQRATHGFDPALPSMGATFIAWGPACKRGVTLPPFDNVEVYSLVCAILGLTPAPGDGTGRLALDTLIAAPSPTAAH
jgi:predicted AlkP superfamily pyrophosphatase or phosphodiesterase